MRLGDNFCGSVVLLLLKTLIHVDFNRTKLLSIKNEENVQNIMFIRAKRTVELSFLQLRVTGDFCLPAGQVYVLCVNNWCGACK